MAAHHAIAFPGPLLEPMARDIVKSFRSTSSLNGFDIDHGCDRFIIIGNDQAVIAFISYLNDYVKEGTGDGFVKSEGRTSHQREDSSSKQDEATSVQPRSSAHAAPMTQLTASRRWEPKQSKGNHKPSVTVLQRICAATQCALNPSKDMSSYEVQGLNDLEVEIAIRRLSIVNEAEITHTPVFVDHLCNESGKPFNVAFRSWRDVASLVSKRPDMLVPSEVESLEPMLLVMPIDQHGRLQPKIPSKRFVLPVQLWDNHRWHPIGVLANSLQNDYKGPVEAWLDETPGPSAVGTCELKGGTRPQDLHPESTPVPTATRRVRRAKDSHQLGRSVPEKTTSQTPLPLVPLNMVPETRTTARGQECTLLIDVDSVDPPYTETKSHTADSRARLHMTQMAITKLASNKPVDRSKYGQLSLIDAESSIQCTNPTERYKTVPKSRMSEMDINFVLSKIYDMLRLASLRHGPVKLQLEIGKIFIDPDAVSKRSRGRPIAHEMWKATIGAQGLRGIFIDRLTEIYSEGSSILSIKVNGGHDAFFTEPQQRTTRYEIECKTRENESITIGILDDGSHFSRPTSVLMGAINLHYPKRFWDARIAVHASHQVGCDYSLEMDEIIKSFKVNPIASDKLMVSVRGQNPQLGIKGISIVRTTYHRSTSYSDLLLNLAECRQLPFIIATEGNNYYSHCVDLAEEATGVYNIHWSAFGTCVKIDALLHSKASLTLGEEAQWIPEEVAQSNYVEEMVALASQIVPSIDCVGSN